MKEIHYHECNGLLTTCPYGMKEPMYNSLTSTTPSSYADIYVGSFECYKCKHFKGDGKFFKKYGTSSYWSVMCDYERD